MKVKEFFEKMISAESLEAMKKVYSGSKIQIKTENMVTYFFQYTADANQVIEHFDFDIISYALFGMDNNKTIHDDVRHMKWCIIYKSYRKTFCWLNGKKTDIKVGIDFIEKSKVSKDGLQYLTKLREELIIEAI